MLGRLSEAKFDIVFDMCSGYNNISTKKEREKHDLVLISYHTQKLTQNKTDINIKTIKAKEKRDCLE